MVHTTAHASRRTFLTGATAASALPLAAGLLGTGEEVTRANGRPRKVNHLIYSHSHADHIGAASILGKDVIRIGDTETARFLLMDPATGDVAPVARRVLSLLDRMPASSPE